MEKQFCGSKGGNLCDLPVRFKGGCPDFIHLNRVMIRENLGHYQVLREEVLAQLQQEGIADVDDNVYAAAIGRGLPEETALVVAMIESKIEHNMNKLQDKTSLRIIALAGWDRLVSLWIAGQLGETKEQMMEIIKSDPHFGPEAENPNKLREIILRLEGITWLRPADAEISYPLGGPPYFRTDVDDYHKEGVSI